MVAIRPRAARAVKAIRLISRQQRLRTLERNVLREQRVLHAVEGAPATGRAFVELNLLLAHGCLLGT
ncbi:hypothetical protein SDC9_151732 [bioreactor metagenome]|uniref:Uncharacterized protein n=1 Tax=bioreactor metagenome TaxID=1076179 RepID=A0A645ER51_9ZZZZ